MSAMEGTAVSADGIPISFEAHGAGGPTHVFIHGWSCDRRYWKHQVHRFADGHQVVAIDLAGHGQSGDGRQTWSMPAFAEDVVAVVDQLGLEEMVLIGHSMGGDVIVEAARRLGDRVVAIVWVDVYRILGDPRSAKEVEAFMAPFRADFVPAARDFMRRLFMPTSDEELVEWVAGDVSSAPPEIALGALAHTISSEPATVNALRELRLPVVALNADFWPSDVENLMRHGVGTVLLPGVGHFPMLEDPVTFNRVLEETVESFGRTGYATRRP